MVLLFSGTIGARILKLGLHMDCELLYFGVENWAYCFCSYLYLSIYLPFQGNFVSQFSQELCKLQFSNKAYIWKINDCMVGPRLRLVTLILSFCFSVFLSIF